MGNTEKPVFLVHLGAGFEEASRGDGKAVKRRIAALEGVEVLSLTDEAVSLSKALVSHGGVPEKALDDALHIAIAAVHCVDYLSPGTVGISTTRRRNR